MDNETALPTGDTAAAGEQATTQATPAIEVQTGEQQQQVTTAAEPGEGEQTPEQKEAAAKKEKTPEQREIERLRRRVDNTTRQKYTLQAELEQLRGGRQQPAAQEGNQGGDDEPVTLTRAELNRQIEEQAARLAPSIKEQQAEHERRQGVVQKLSKEWGKDEFDAKASDLDDVFGGLVDRSGRPKPATDAIFEADDPKAVIEYLTDPDNAEEAERIARLPRGRADREIVRIETRIAEAKKAAKPKPSAAAKPLEAVKGGGVPSGMPDPSNTKAYIAWANAQDRARQ